MKNFMYEAYKLLVVILGFFGVGLGLWLVHKNDMEKQSKLISDNYERGYIDACKDFYKGKPKYELVKNDDGTVIWKKVNK